jgi:hypothetical protein
MLSGKLFRKSASKLKISLKIDNFAMYKLLANFFLEIFVDSDQNNQLKVHCAKIAINTSHPLFFKAIFAKNVPVAATRKTAQLRPLC